MKAILRTETVSNWSAANEITASLSSKGIESNVKQVGCEIIINWAELESDNQAESNNGASEQLKELVERAILVAYYRNGDIDTEDGTFATTDTDEMIRLESAIQDLFGLEACELVKSLNSKIIIDNKLKESITELQQKNEQVSIHFHCDVV